MSFDETKVNRQAAGTSKGGQFAAKNHPENTEVSLSEYGQFLHDKAAWERRLLEKVARGEISGEEIDSLITTGAVHLRVGRKMKAVNGDYGPDELSDLLENQNINRDQWRELYGLQPGHRDHAQLLPMPQVPQSLQGDFDLDVATESYLEAAAWTEEEYLGLTGAEDWNEDDRLWAKRQVVEFVRDNEEAVREAIGAPYGLDIYGSDEFGHDLWLTRNGHGAGFWDRGLGEVGRKLSHEAQLLGGEDIWFDEDRGTLGIE